MSPAQRAARERLAEGLKLRSPEVIASLARRSGAKTLFKRLLPLAAVLLLIALVVAPGLRNGPDANRVSYRVQSGAGATASRMSGATYHGMDQRGQPFTLTADAASQLDNDRLALQQPEGDISLKSGAWLELRSDAGMFRQKQQTLGLNGNVTLYRNDGTTMTASAADIDLKHGDASSAVPVQVQGPFGTLHADNGFSLTDRGARIVFNGPATLVLTQAGAASATGAP